MGLIGYKVVVDPTPLPGTPYPVLYAAFSNGPTNLNGGLYRSLDGGADWVLAPNSSGSLANGTATPIMAGNATDVVLAAGSADAHGNLQQLYAAFQGLGVYGTTSATSATTLAQLAGGLGDPSRQNVDGPTPVTVGVSNPASTPNGANGRIVLATPALTSSPLENSFYEGWLYAAVSNVSDSGLAGLYVSKDFGRNWTMIQLPEVTGAVPVYGTNNTSRAKIDTLADPNPLDDQITGIADLSLTVDPTNPNIVYLGGAGYNLLRVDITNLADAYAAVPYTNIAPDGGTVQFASTGSASLNGPGGRFGIYDVFTPNTPLTNPPTYPLEQGPSGSTGWYNLERDPLNPFANPSTLQVTNYSNINNQGTGVLWGELGNLTNSAGVGILGNQPDPITGNAAAILTSSIDIRAIVAIRDPLTGETRLLIGDDNGVFTGADQTSTALQNNVGTAQEVIGSRNGNLQLADMADSAAQPSSLAANIAGALFYGSSQFNNGFPQSSAQPARHRQPELDGAEHLSVGERPLLPGQRHVRRHRPDRHRPVVPGPLGETAGPVQHRRQPAALRVHRLLPGHPAWGGIDQPHPGSHSLGPEPVAVAGRLPLRGQPGRPDGPGDQFPDRSDLPLLRRHQRHRRAVAADHHRRLHPRRLRRRHGLRRPRSVVRCQLRRLHLRRHRHRPGLGHAHRQAARHSWTNITANARRLRRRADRDRPPREHATTSTP